MTVEERIQALENEVALMKQKKPAYTLTAYREAVKKCEAHYASVRMPGQDFGGLMYCEHLARKAFKDKHKVTGDALGSPGRYIRTEEDALEYFDMFKKFLTVYQDICSTSKERSTTNE